MSRTLRQRGALAFIAAAALVACGGGIETEDTRGRTTQSLSIQMLTTCTPEHRQDTPAISGTRVVFTDSVSPGTNGSSNSLNVGLLDLAGSGPPIALTNAEQGWNFLPDIAGDVVAFMRVIPGTSLGDIVAIDLRRQVEWTVAVAAPGLFWFEVPAVGGNYLTYTRWTSTTSDIEAYDLVTGGVPPPITNDAALQLRPRTDGGWIVYEDYGAANPAVKALSTATGWPAISVTDGTTSASTPDVDGGVVVYVAHVGGADQIFLFDTVTRTSTQLTTTPSTKRDPRISAGHVVWTDDRNGSLDIFGYDIATRTEVALATGPGAEYSADIDRDRVVFTTTAETGCAQIAALRFPEIMPPPTVGSVSDAIRDLAGSGDIKNQGLANALSSQLASAAAKRAAGDCAAAEAILQAFIATVTAQSGKAISATAAATLIGDAEYLIDHCP